MPFKGWPINQWIPALLLSGCFLSACTRSVSTDERSASSEKSYVFPDGWSYTNSRVAITPKSPASKVIAVANELLLRKGKDWGRPVEVTWLGEPLNLYRAIYPTPESERRGLGYRTILVETNGLVMTKPRWHDGTYTNRRIVITPQSPASNVMAVANQLVLRAGLDWGQPVKVEWQGEPLNLYFVSYPTPESERWKFDYRGRGIHVETNGLVLFKPELLWGYTNRRTVITPQSPVSNVIAVANELLLRAGVVDWGQPVKVEWVGDRFAVDYATPDSERAVGPRGVLVTPEGWVLFTPRL